MKLSENQVSQLKAFFENRNLPPVAQLLQTLMVLPCMSMTGAQSFMHL
jgi:hypothetical protein